MAATAEEESNRRDMSPRVRRSSDDLERRLQEEQKMGNMVNLGVALWLNATPRQDTLGVIQFVRRVTEVRRRI